MEKTGKGGLRRVCLHSRVTSLPRACRSLPAQWHHHWGELELVVAWDGGVCGKGGYRLRWN